MTNPSNPNSKTPGENESLAPILDEGKNDPVFRTVLCTILEQPSFHRNSLLNMMIAHMRTEGVREDIIQAMTSLTDDAVAKRALEALKE